MTDEERRAKNAARQRAWRAKNLEKCRARERQASAAYLIRHPDKAREKAERRQQWYDERLVERRAAQWRRYEELQANLAKRGRRRQ